MDELASTEFRKQYASLRKPTAVTVNGHVIGQWIPAHSATYVMARVVGDDGKEKYEAHGLSPPRDALTAPGGAPRGTAILFSGGTPRPTDTPQKQRDELLNKINRSK